jgi:hypothetical protein
MASDHGNANTNALGLDHMGQGREDQQRAADVRAKGLAATIAKIQNAGFISINAITRELSEREIPTALGGKWHSTSVKGWGRAPLLTSDAEPVNARPTRARPLRSRPVRPGNP